MSIKMEATIRKASERKLSSLQSDDVKINICFQILKRFVGPENPETENIFTDAAVTVTFSLPFHCF